MLGGFGSIQAMITSLKNNANLLRKKNIYHKGHEKYEGLVQSVKRGERKFVFKKASASLLREIRERAQRENKRKLRLMVGVFTAIAILFTWLIVANLSTPAAANPAHPQVQAKLKEKKSKYDFLIADAKQWMKKEKTHNAIFQYSKALELFPNDITASYGLASAYIMDCEMNGLNCKEADELINSMRNLDIKPARLSELRKKFELAQSESP